MDKPSDIVVFAEEDLHPFYQAYADGLESTEILDYREGPDWVRRGRAELALIDCGPRIKQGLDLLKEIKKARPSTMVVVITEGGSEDAALEAFHSGARSYLKKPVGLDSLCLMSKSLLDLKKGTRESRPLEVPPAAPADLAKDTPANLNRAVDFMEGNLGGPLGLDGCARAAGLGKFQFCRAFKRHFGMAPMRFVKSLRISRAQDLLSRGGMTIGEIAGIVGYKDPRSLSRIFKEETGVRPREFRSRARSCPYC